MATVAQLVEQRIRNAWVGGSNPLNGTISSYIHGTKFALFPSTHLIAQVIEAKMTTAAQPIP